MFRKCFRFPLIVLLALVMHIFVGQHDSPSALVLCLGEDGHVALEMAQHANHPAQINQIEQAAAHFSNCDASENCQDILLSFAHQDMSLSSKAKPLSLPLFYHALFAGAYSQASIAEPKLFYRPEPHRDLAYRDLSSQNQTLKHTILII